MAGTAEQREQAKREIRLRNMKDIFELPDELKVAGPTVRIFNVGPWPFQRSMGSYGQWLIHACEPGFLWDFDEGQSEGSEERWVKRELKAGEVAYSRPTEVPYITNDPVHIDMNQMAHRHDSGKKLALDILGVGQFHTPGEDMTIWGVFVAAGKTPTKQELLGAIKKLNKTFDQLIAEADNYYNQGPIEYKNVTDMHRIAAKSRGQMDKPWARGVVEKKECPVCHESIMPDAAFCIHCRTPLNEEVLIAHKVPGFEYLWKKETKRTRREQQESEEE